MTRAVIGAAVGFCAGLLGLALYGAWDGYTNGGWTRRDLPPGWQAAVSEAFVFVAYFWWLAGGVGAVIGGLAGLGSWLVRPRAEA